MQRLFYDNRLPKSVGATFQLDPEESKHAARVLRLTTGTDVELCNGLGELVTGRITGTDKSAVSVTTSSAVQQVPKDAQMCAVLMSIHWSPHFSDAFISVLKLSNGLPAQCAVSLPVAPHAMLTQAQCKRARHMPCG